MISTDELIEALEMFGLFHVTERDEDFIVLEGLGAQSGVVLSREVLLLSLSDFHEIAWQVGLVLHQHSGK